MRYWTEMERLESTGTRIVRLNGGAPVTRGWHESLEGEVGSCVARGAGSAQVVVLGSCISRQLSVAIIYVSVGEAKMYRVGSWIRPRRIYLLASAWLSQVLFDRVVGNRGAPPARA